MTANRLAIPLVYEPISQTPISAVIVFTDIFMIDLTNLFTGRSEHFEIGFDMTVNELFIGLIDAMRAVIGDPTGDVLPYSR